MRGPNGAGKTTLLRACAGLVGISSGEAHVLGHDLKADRRAVRRRVGLLGHAAFLYDDLTVADNLRFAARASGSSKAAADAASARLGLDGRLRDLTAAKLSAGQRRRVALAAVLARQPDLWLLDEPHAGLDAAGRDLLDELVREAAAAGATVLLASHELERANALATRSVVIAGGQVRDGLLARRRSRRRPPRPPSSRPSPRSRPMWRDAALVAGKDLRVEARSRVGVNQVVPFALLILVLFAFALDSDREVLTKVGPGLFWVAVMFSALLGIQRSFVIEADDDARDALRLSGLDGAGIFLGKAGAIAVQLVVLEVVLAVGVIVLYDIHLQSPVLLAAHLPDRDRRAGRRRYGLRHHRRRSPGARHPPPAARPPRPGPRVAGRGPGLRRCPRRHPLRRLAVGPAAGRLRHHLCHLRRRRLRRPARGSLTEHPS